MNTKRLFNTTQVPRSTEVFPQAVIAGNMIFVSGTTGVKPSTAQLSPVFKEQARQAFLNIKTILNEAGSSLDNIVKTTVFMVSGNTFSDLNDVYAELFPTNAPARSTPQVMPFPSGILISVECIAMMP